MYLLFKLQHLLLEKYSRKVWISESSKKEKNHATTRKVQFLVGGYNFGWDRIGGLTVHKQEPVLWL